MNLLYLLAASAPIADMTDKTIDPHGAILTLVSVSVVFGALIMLCIAYSLIGKIYSRPESLKKNSNKLPVREDAEPEICAAISMALHQYLNENAHDKESYKITIKRK